MYRPVRVIIPAMRKANLAHTFVIDGSQALQPDENGYLAVNARVTKAGVFPYARGGKLVGVLRHPEDVFHADSLATLALKPITYEHPAERYVDAKSARKVQVGSSGDTVTVVDQDGALVADAAGAQGAAARVRIVITDAEIVDKVVRGGVRTFSAGYSCDIEDVRGEYLGKPYEQKQTNIRYNHIAITGRPRLGMDMTIADDAAFCYDLPQEPKSMKFKAQKIGGHQFAEVTIADAAEAQAELDRRAAAVDAAVTEARKEADSATGKLAALQAELDTAKREKQADSMTPERMQAAINKRLDLLAVAGHFKVGVKHTDSDDAIMTAVLASRQIKTDGFSSEALSGAFSTLAQQVADHSAALASLSTLRAASATPAKEGDGEDGAKEGDAVSPRQKYIDSQVKGWKAQEQK